MNQIKKLIKDKYIFVDLDTLVIPQDILNNHVTFVYLSSKLRTWLIKTINRVRNKGIWVCGCVTDLVELRDKLLWLEENKGLGDFSGAFWYVPESHWHKFLNYFKNLEKSRISENSTCIQCSNGLIIEGTAATMWDWVETHNMVNLNESVYLGSAIPNIMCAEQYGVKSYNVDGFGK